MIRHTIHLTSTDSTNRYLRDAYRQSLPQSPIRTADVVVVSADYQEAGRGQGTNSWESAPGENLLCSLLVCPEQVKARQQFVLSMAGGLALYDVLNSVSGEIRLKWPNDVYWRDNKLSGTLIETTLERDCIRTCMFGIGLNVNQQTFNANVPNGVSLFHILGRTTPVSGWLDSIVEAFWQRIEQINGGQYDRIRADYHTALYRREGWFTYRDAQGEFEAVLVGVEDDGHLVLRDRTDQMRRYAFKEVEYLF